MDKKALSERDFCTQFITPAITAAGWDVHTQVREEVHLTRGRVIARGRMVSRGTPKRADYVLYFRPNFPIAVVAKDNNHIVGAGMQQAIGYAELLDVPFTNDQPASVLLERIEAEKKRLHAEGKIGQPEKLPLIRPEEMPFEAPEGWEWARAGRVRVYCWW